MANPDKPHDRPTVPMVAPLVRALYDEFDECTTGAGNVGGHFHIVLDDGNVEDGHVQWCLDEAREANCVTCIRLGELMIQMTLTQRKRLAARAYDLAP